MNEHSDKLNSKEDFTAGQVVTAKAEAEIERKRRLVGSFLRILITVVVLGVLLFHVQTPYMFQAPGSCEDVSEFVEVVGGKKVNTLGRFFLTTVIYEKANVFLYLWGVVDGSADLIPVEKSKKIMTDSDRNAIMEEQMESSKLKAKIAAFRELGYRVKVEKEPVGVVKILPWSEAGKILKVGDKITAIEGDPVKMEEELIKRVKTYSAEEKVNLTIIRDKKVLNVKVPLTEHNGEAKIGIIVFAPIRAANLPMEVKIDSKNIIGASAGLMFALEILRQVTGADLTGGYQIAGTGAIDQEGNVYPIEGVKFKIQAAQDRGADHFLVPRENYAGAKSVDEKIKIHPVENLRDALDVLEKLNPSASIDKYRVDQKKEIER